MKKILFNKGQQFTKGGAKMDVIELQDIIVKEGIAKSDLPWLQLFNTGYRVTSDKIDWSGWNGCVYSDIDSKHYYNECKKFDVDKLCSALYEYLLINVNDYFYCLQQSNSKTSFHILFYFDVAKTEDSFKKCAQLVQDITREAFYGIGAGEIYDWPKVNDGCSKSPLQGMFLTNNPIQYGHYDQPGFGIVEDFETYQLRSEKETRVSDISIDGSKLFKLGNYRRPKRPIEYKDHYQRRTIYDALIGVFEDRSKVDEQWECIICNLLPEANGHTKTFYLNEPAKNRWYERHTAATLVFVSVLKPFGYSFRKTFIPEAGAVQYEADVVYELKENERLSDINIDWDHNRINHLYAGCSLGKTYNAIVLGRPREMDVIDWIFGGYSLDKIKVCFVSPMKSINVDSFKNERNWVIVDGDHKLDNTIQYGSIQNAIEAEGVNICTTWESYCNNEMWKFKFDYVIVDEVHTFYMYDYRLRSIKEMKKALKASKGIRIIMTGTPSYEVKEFDCKKIHVKKSLSKVPSEIVFYNTSFKGHYMSDILSWTKDSNHYAIIFYDQVNYRIEDSFKSYGLHCSIFNTNYKENVKKILEANNVISQISAFSVYGQAGINLHIDEDKKVRVYILNGEGIGIIQYANRIRNRSVIDKIMIGYKNSAIYNGVRKIKDNVDFQKAEAAVDQINKTTYINKDLLSKKDLSIIKLNYGLSNECLDWVDGKYVLNHDIYETYFRIKEVTRYEKQIRVIYDRLLNNDFDITLTYLDSDTQEPAQTRLRSNTFAGQITKVNFKNSVVLTKENKFWFNPSEALKKVCTGNLEKTIEELFDLLSEKYVNIDDIQRDFDNYISYCIQSNGTVKKSDIDDYVEVLKLKKRWEYYYDNSFVVALKNEKWDLAKITAMYVRSIYKEGVNWKKASDEAYSQFKRLKGLVNRFGDQFDDAENTNTVTTVLDDLTVEIYNYVLRKHSRGRKPKTGKVSRTTEWRRKKSGA